MSGHTPDWLQDIRDYWSQLNGAQSGAGEGNLKRPEAEVTGDLAAQMGSIRTGAHGDSS